MNIKEKNNLRDKIIDSIFEMKKAYPDEEEMVILCNNAELIHLIHSMSVEEINQIPIFYCFGIKVYTIKSNKVLATEWFQLHTLSNYLKKEYIDSQIEIGMEITNNIRRWINEPKN